MLNTSPEVLGAGFTGGHVVTITLQTGGPTLSTRAQTEAVINQLFEALNSDDVSALPLAQTADLSLPEKISTSSGLSVCPVFQQFLFKLLYTAVISSAAGKSIYILLFTQAFKQADAHQ